MNKQISRVLIGVVILCSVCAHTEESKTVKKEKFIPKAGKPAADFALKNTEDKEVRLSDYKEKKVVIVNFFSPT